MSPKITVFMPVYNGQEYLKEAIESILNQTFDDFEFFIINDCSTDNSANIIKSYSDRRIKFIENHTNLGPIGVSNMAFDLANGEYIVRMDQDDISLPKRIEKQVDFMDKNSRVGVCGSWVQFFGDVNYVAKYAKSHKKIITNMFTNSPFAHPATILRKDMFNQFNLRYSPVTGEEYELWVKASRYMLFANIPTILLKYRNSSNQITKSTEATLKANQIVWKMQLENLDIDFSSEELNLHYLLMSEKYCIEDLNEFIYKTNNWFDKIIAANNKKQIYDSEILKDLLRQKWYIAFKTITEREYNLNVWSIFSNEKQFEYLSNKNKFKFLYRFFKKKHKNSTKNPNGTVN